MAGEVLNMNILTTNIIWCELKDLCFKIRHKPYTNRWWQAGTVKKHPLQS